MCALCVWVCFGKPQYTLIWSEYNVIHTAAVTGNTLAFLQNRFDFQKTIVKTIVRNRYALARQNDHFIVGLVPNKMNFMPFCVCVSSVMNLFSGVSKGHPILWFDSSESEMHDDFQSTPFEIDHNNQLLMLMYGECANQSAPQMIHFNLFDGRRSNVYSLFWSHLANSSQKSILIESAPHGWDKCNKKNSVCARIL